jgi:hypothetical protein
MRHEKYREFHALSKEQGDQQGRDNVELSSSTEATHEALKFQAAYT